MLSWAITFLVIALIAAVLGFTGIAGTAVGIAENPVRDLPGSLPGVLGGRSGGTCNPGCCCAPGVDHR